MTGLEWLKPAVVFGSMLYALIGVVIFWICFVIVDKKNVALAIVVGSTAIAIGMIVSAAVHG